MDIALLKSRAHRLYMTSVKLTFEGIRFDFYENPKIKLENLGALLDRYRNFINLYMVPAPHIVLRPMGGRVGGKSGGKSGSKSLGSSGNSGGRAGGSHRQEDHIAVLSEFFTTCEELLL